MKKINRGNNGWNLLKGQNNERLHLKELTFPREGKKIV